MKRAKAFGEINNLSSHNVKPGEEERNLISSKRICPEKLFHFFFFLFVSSVSLALRKVWSGFSLEKQQNKLHAKKQMKGRRSTTSHAGTEIYKLCTESSSRRPLSRFYIQHFWCLHFFSPPLAAVSKAPKILYVHSSGSPPLTDALHNKFA
jgi:hypothetical protein